jgi:hypothetical protein
MMSNTNILFSLDFQINFALHDDPDPLQTQPFARIVSYWLMDKSSWWVSWLWQRLLVLLNRESQVEGASLSFGLDATQRGRKRRLAFPSYFSASIRPPPSSISTPQLRHGMASTPFDAMYRCQYLFDVLMSTLSSLAHINVDHWRLNLVVCRG